MQRWDRLWQAIGTSESQGDLYDRLLQAYTGNDRAYHNMHHIRHCLDEFDSIKHALHYPNEVELAIWFHDIVYDTQSSNNEAASADYAAAALMDAKASRVHMDRVKDLILATKHDRQPDSSDTKYLVDIDIAIFGQPPDVYITYEQNIRKEYNWVAENLYKEGRKEVLMSFLNRNIIFHTEFFTAKYEKIARTNLERALRAL